MKTIFLIIIIYLFSFGWAGAESPKRITIIVANNISEKPQRPTLQFADDDAIKYYRLFAPVSHKIYLLASFDPSTQKRHTDLISLCLEPSRKELLRVLEQVQEMVKHNTQPSQEFELIFVYCGHGGIDSEGLGYIELVRSRFTRNDLMEIMDDRHGQSATAILSQLPTGQWYQSIGDNTLADAILDRLMHNAHRINLKGESMRKKMNSLTQVEHLE